MVDLVGSQACLSGLLSLWKTAGFEQYQTLYRMARPERSTQAALTADLAAGGAEALGPPSPFAVTGSHLGYAQEGDTTAILELLCGSFDHRAEQLPMGYEIEAATRNRQNLLARRDGALAGMLFFETQGFTSTVRYWLVAERFRSAGVGSALMNHYFATQTGVRRFVLWVIAENHNSIEKYKHYGFMPDGLLDFVLVNKRTTL